ncbi:MAG: DUF4286 family protein [Chitinophagaceae bacterium]
MFIYNVTIQVGRRIQLQWLDWTKKVYIPEILATGTFHDFRICELLEQENPDGITYAIQFFSDSLENYQTFQKEYAGVIQEKARRLFGQNSIGFCTLMKVVS